MNEQRWGWVPRGVVLFAGLRLRCSQNKAYVPVNLEPLQLSWASP